jgi:hypothetical protein
MLNSSSRDDLIWRDAENSFIFEFLKGEDDAESHTDWQ